MNHLNAIKKFISKFTINPDQFSVSHKDAGSIEYSKELIKTLKKLPENIQNDFFMALLMDVILDVYNNEKNLFAKYQINRSFEGSNIKNSRSEVDWDFLNTIHKNNTSQGWYNPGFTVVKVNCDKTLTVTKKGITTIINNSCDFTHAEKSEDLENTISIWTHPYQLSEYFYTAFGNEMCILMDRVYLYLNLSPQGATLITNFLTSELNRDKIPFMFYILHNPNNYHRYDSGFLIFEKKDYAKLKLIIEVLYSKYQTYLRPQVPIFTKKIAPGISVAEPSTMSFKSKDDFGLERSEILATSLIMTYQNKDSSIKSCLKCIENIFEDRNYSLKKPYLKSNSEDVFEPLF